MWSDFRDSPFSGTDKTSLNIYLKDRVTDYISYKGYLQTTFLLIYLFFIYFCSFLTYFPSFSVLTLNLSTRLKPWLNKGKAMWSSQNKVNLIRVNV